MPSSKTRRAGDVLRAVDGLLRTHLEGTAVGARPLANLAVAMAIDFCGAEWGSLLLDEEGELVPAIRLGEGAEAGFDGDLLERARSGQRTAVAGPLLAAPVIESGRVRGLLYLAMPSQPVAPEDAQLASDIAARIGSLLQSGELIEALSRRTENMGLLEALGACLASGSLGGEHLEEALAGAVSATRSREGLLALLNSDGALLQIHVSGPDEAALRRLGRDLAASLGGGRGGRPESLLGERHLFEPLRPDLVPTGEPGSSPPAVGFLMVRGAANAYDGADNSFFRAVVHLLNGALARLDYFRQAAEDPLTETGSRLALHLKLSEAQALALETGEPFSVILVDVDRFKQINDLYGHLVGDQVLRQIAAVLRSRLRADDSVARYGGDEFVVILPMTGAEEAARLAGELRRLVAARSFSEHGLKVSLSLGVSSFGGERHGPLEVLERADRALYASKSAGRDRVTVD